MPRLQPCPLRQSAQRLVCCLCLLVLPTLCAAQHQPFLTADLDNKIVKVDVKAATLEAMVALLAKQLNANIVVDDSPHHIPLDFSLEVTARKALDRIAAAYDYEWRLTKRGVLILNKRFTDPAEFPQMNLAEWKQQAKDVLDILGQHDFTGGSGLALRAFVESLTREQVSAIHAGKHVLVSMLNENQVALLREFMYVRLLEHTAFDWNEIADAIKMLPGSSILMTIADDFADIYISKEEHRPQRKALTLVINFRNKYGNAISNELYSLLEVRAKSTRKISGEEK